VIEHGACTDEAVVLLHGFTTCPKQWDVIAAAMAAQGRSVVVPRLPGHGYRDRLTRALSDTQPADLVEAAHGAVDIAAGLGRRVTVVGLSGGGTLAAWLAGHRDDVAEAVLFAPLIVPKVVPDVLAGPLSRFPEHGVDLYLWWDAHLRADLATPPYAYPRYSVRSLAAFLAIGREASAPTRVTLLDRLTVVTNDNDAAVSNDAVAEVDAALAPRAREHRAVVFPIELGYRHDVIDPRGESAGRIHDIYGRIGPLLGLPDLADSLPAG
jgi:carboxylesterase